MVKVTYVQSDGSGETFEIDVGRSVMDGAVQNGVPGIDADCGGALACATCHVKVHAEWIARVGAPQEVESEMLDSSSDVDERSRLACQIELTPELDGLIVDIPASQR